LAPPRRTVFWRDRPIGGVGKVGKGRKGVAIKGGERTGKVAMRKRIRPAGTVRLSPHNAVNKSGSKQHPTRKGKKGGTRGTPLR